ncbi:MFS transporter [Cupriavidus basilensis]
MKVMLNSRSLWWTCLGGAFQVIVISTIWAWMPSYLNRSYGLAPARAGMLASMVVLSGALGVIFWGFVSDRISLHKPRNKLVLMAALCFFAPLLFGAAFSGRVTGFQAQFLLVLIGGFLMTCSIAPVCRRRT